MPPTPLPTRCALHHSLCSQAVVTLGAVTLTTWHCDGCAPVHTLMGCTSSCHQDCVLCVLDKKAYSRVLRNEARAKLAVVADQLQRVAVVCDWRRSMVLRVATLVHTRRYSQGETITRAGSTAGVVHIICRGAVRVVHEPGEYDEPAAHGAAAVYLPGERLQTSLLGGKPRPIELAILGASPAFISWRSEEEGRGALTLNV